MKLRKLLALALAVMMLVSVLPMDAMASWMIGPTGSTCNHTWAVGYLKEATCTEGGWTQYACTLCGAINTTEYTDPLGHDMGPWYDVVVATPDHPGIQQSDCSRGDHSETRDTFADSTDSTTPTDPNKPNGPIDPPDYPEVNAHLVLTLDNLPSIGYFNNENRDAHLTYTLYNDSDYILNDVVIEYPGHGTDYMQSTYYGYLWSHRQTSSYEWAHKVLPGIPYFTGPTYEAQTAIAHFTVEGVPYTIYSNTVILPADKSPSALQVTLTPPTLPSCGFFVENQTVTVPSTLTAVESDFDQITWFSYVYGDSDLKYTNVAAGDSFSREYTFTVSAADCVRGYHTVYSYAEGLDITGYVSTAEAMIDVPCGIYSMEDPLENLELTIQPLSTPDNGMYYVEGETIEWALIVHDTGITPFAGEFLLSQSFPDAINFGNQWWATASHVVNATDLLDGYLLVIGELAFTTSYLESDYRTAHISFPCGPEKIRDVAISKTVTSTPANGSFYVPGEWVTYRIDFTNTGNCDEGVFIIDPMLFPTEVYVLKPGESSSCVGSYQITDADADAGSLTNTVRANVSWDGDSLDRCASVTVPTGHGELTPSLSVHKMLNPGCKPSNGSRFQEGESLNYTIVVSNTGNEVLINVTVYDDRDSGFMYYIGTMEPGEIVEVPFSSTVIDKDCQMHWALNTAYVVWADKDMIDIQTSTSNTVAVPAGDYTSVLTGHGACNRTILAAGEGAWQYQQDYCSVHGAVCQDAKTVSAAEAAELWKDAVEQLYADWFAAVQGEKLTAAREDREAFFTMLDAFEAVANNPELTARILESKCTELCNELYSDPDEPCAASWDTENLSAMDEPHGEFCSVLWEPQDSGSALLTEVCCETHNERLNRMLQSGLIEGAENLQWALTRVSSKAVLKSVYNQLFAEDGQSAALSCSAFTAYLEQHEQTLALYRELSEDALSEAFSRSIMDHITMLCSAQS